MKLAIISHTEHYKTATGTLVGWGPTVTEINQLSKDFDTIYHLGMLHTSEAPASALPYESDRIVFVPLPVLGGRSLSAKLDLLLQAPTVIRIISKTLKQVDWFQFRAPTGIGVYVIPFLSLCIKTPGWFKYAGNWNQIQPPLGYRLQRWMLKQQQRKVTINGFWEQQAQQCLSFENPCLTTEEVAIGQRIGAEKRIEGALRFCFVGRLEDEKGVGRIISAFTTLPEALKQRVAGVDLVGNGVRMTQYKAQCLESGVPFQFHGTLPRSEVHDIYKKAHVLLLPTTASEGFPKVIAEAMNYGCIPIVSDISSIGHYVTDGQQGFLMPSVTVDVLKGLLLNVFELDAPGYARMVAAQRPMVASFTFSQYRAKIQNLIVQQS